MTEKQLCELPIPKWLGRPMYPGGIPLRQDQVSFEGKTVEEMYRKRVDDICERKVPPNIDDEEFLRYYVVYHVHAPIWEDPDNPGYIEELRDALDPDEMSLDTMIYKCLDYGIDPL